MPNFQEKIKGLRIERGLTQKQLANLLNVSQNAVYNWENGKREPSMDMQKKIAKIFDIALYMLLDDSFSLPDTTSESWKKLDDGKPLTEKERQLIKEYVNSDTFRKNLAELPAHFKKLADSIRKSYSLLNAEGKKEAVKQIELAGRQIELLTEIPKYRKSDNEE